MPLSFSLPHSQSVSLPLKLTLFHAFGLCLSLNLSLFLSDSLFFMLLVFKSDSISPQELYDLLFRSLALCLSIYLPLSNSLTHVWTFV